MTTTDPAALPAIADPTQLSGMTEVRGLHMAMLGEDGDRVLILGHHDEPQLRTAAAEYLSQFFPPDTATELAEMYVPERATGRFTPDPNSPTGNWWCTWTADTPDDGRVPITILPIE